MLGLLSVCLCMEVGLHMTSSALLAVTVCMWMNRAAPSLRKTSLVTAPSLTKMAATAAAAAVKQAEAQSLWSKRLIPRVKV